MRRLSDCTEFFMISALPPPNDQTCLASFLESSPEMNESRVKVIPEGSSREDTLNSILKKRNQDKDLFVFVNDIRFRGGWWQALEQGREFGDIVGFSMVDPKTNKLQDFGYDFIAIDGRLSYRGLFKHEPASRKNLRFYRECAAVCGCAMWISKRVFEHVLEFSPEGKNRWCEMIFCHEAKKMGFKTIVLSSHLRHFGTSTKNTGSVFLSSPSWLIERDLWDGLAKKYFRDAPIVENLVRMIDPSLQAAIDGASKVLLYGCGTVADFVASRLTKKEFNVASGLSEEIGLQFHGRTVLDINRVVVPEWDLVLVTPIGYKRQLKHFFDQKLGAEIRWLTESRRDEVLVYSSD